MNSQNDIKFSVVIPVYNAAEYVEHAVISALAQPETGEVILIEDGSPDASWQRCLALSKKYLNVHAYQHENGKNKGAAASRNFGIEISTLPFIAFLDADDYFLPNRFLKATEIFQRHDDADGVYDAIGSVFEDEQLHGEFVQVGLRETTTIKNNIKPENLFEALMRGGAGGYYSIIGFTARKEVFSKISIFDEDLHMYEDTMLMFKLSAKARLYPGNLTQPVSIRRVHQANRITKRFADQEKKYQSLCELWLKLIDWGKVNLSDEQLSWVLYKALSHMRTVDIDKNTLLKNFMISRRNIFRLAIDNPVLIGTYGFWRSLFPG